MTSSASYAGYDTVVNVLENNDVPLPAAPTAQPVDCIDVMEKSNDVQILLPAQIEDNIECIDLTLDSPVNTNDVSF